LLSLLFLASLNPFICFCACFYFSHHDRLRICHLFCEQLSSDLIFVLFFLWSPVSNPNCWGHLVYSSSNIAIMISLFCTVIVWWIKWYSNSSYLIGICLPTALRRVLRRLVVAIRIPRCGCLAVTLKRFLKLREKLKMSWKQHKSLYNQLLDNMI
jgi:hypothetical protein